MRYGVQSFLFHNLQQWDYIVTASSIWQHINCDVREQNTIETIERGKMISCYGKRLFISLAHYYGLKRGSKFAK
jgi:hypothetical protein